MISANFFSSIEYVYFGFIVTALSKYVAAFSFKGSSTPVWSICLLSFVVYCLVEGFLDFLGVSIIGALIISCYFTEKASSVLVRWVSGVFAVMIFLGMGFKLLPGFNNQLLIEAQQLKGDSSLYWQSMNFDKFFAGLVFFLMLVPKQTEWKNQSTANLVLIIFLVPVFVLLGGWLGGLVSLNFDYYFNVQFFLLFVISQIFMVSLTEEVFFRGFIQQRLYLLFKKNTKYYQLLPIAVSSILFGLVHFAGGLGYVIAATAAGFGYGLIYQISRRIELSIIAHAFLNTIHLMFFTYPFIQQS